MGQAVEAWLVSSRLFTSSSRCRLSGGFTTGRVRTSVRCVYVFPLAFYLIVVYADKALAKLIACEMMLLSLDAMPTWPALAYIFGMFQHSAGPLHFPLDFVEILQRCRPQFLPITSGA